LAAVLSDQPNRAASLLGEDAPTFDANCARLFKLDYHLSEFRRWRLRTPHNAAPQQRQVWMLSLLSAGYWLIV